MVSRKYVFIGLSALAAAIVVVALAATLLSGDGEEKGVSAGGTPLSAEVAGAQQTATVAPPTATPVQPTATLEPEPTQLPDRTSCEEIRGTEYRSAQERQFFNENCIATPAPVVSTSTPTSQVGGPQPDSRPSGQVITPTTIEGWWILLFDNGGLQTIKFDGQGKVVAFQPPARAPALSGNGFITGDSMTINASGFVTDSGTSFSFTFNGSRLAEADFARLSLPPGLAAFARDTGGVAFRGELRRSDVQTPNIVVAVWACRDCNLVFTPIP